MDNLSRKEAMNQWLASNPGKTERDWLLDVRCTTDTQRNDLERLFAWADKNNRTIRVCPTVGSFVDSKSKYHEIFNWDDPEEEELYNDIMGEIEFHPTIYIEADFKVVGNQDYYYDLDTPDNVFEQVIPDLYLKWKAEQMGIDPLLAHTDYEIYEAFKPYMGANIPHWRNLIID